MDDQDVYLQAVYNVFLGFMVFLGIKYALVTTIYKVWRREDTCDECKQRKEKKRK